MMTDETKPIDSPILTLEEMAVTLKVQPGWLQKSTCPRMKVGNVVRYHREVGIHWMASHLNSDIAKQQLGLVA